MSTNDLPETTLSVEIWVAGTSVEEALARRDEVIRHMEGASIEHAGAGFGRFFYDLWCANTGRDPLHGLGDAIADAEFYVAAQATTDADLAALTQSITADLACDLGYTVAVNVVRLEPDDAPSGEVDERLDIDPDSRVLIMISERDHAHVLAAIRRVAAEGGLEGTPEAEIAENGQTWGVMNGSEMHDLGDRLSSSVPAGGFGSTGAIR